MAASFTTMHPSAKLAFLVLGPMFDLKLLVMFSASSAGGQVMLIIVSAVVQVFVYTMIVHEVWEWRQIPYINRNAATVVTPVDSSP